MGDEDVLEEDVASCDGGKVEKVVAGADEIKEAPGSLPAEVDQRLWDLEGVDERPGAKDCVAEADGHHMLDGPVVPLKKVRAKRRDHPKPSQDRVDGRSDPSVRGGVKELERWKNDDRDRKYGHNRQEKGHQPREAVERIGAPMRLILFFLFIALIISKKNFFTLGSSRRRSEPRCIADPTLEVCRVRPRCG